MITSYLLVYRNAYPASFPRALVGSKLQDAFIYQICESGKVQSLSDIAFIAALISETPALNQKKERISKQKLRQAILTVLMNCIRNRTGIYRCHNETRTSFKTIFQVLTTAQKNSLRRFLIKEDRTLMADKLDELVRHKIYLKDYHQHEIIQEILSVLG